MPEEEKNKIKIRALKAENEKTINLKKKNKTHTMYSCITNVV